eukprot:1771148-Lingulodinium_polyedra.AAC.1
MASENRISKAQFSVERASRQRPRAELQAKIDEQATVIEQLMTSARTTPKGSPAVSRVGRVDFVGEEEPGRAATGSSVEAER